MGTIFTIIFIIISVSVIVFGISMAVSLEKLITAEVKNNDSI
jgi:hypothetical protein